MENPRYIDDITCREIWGETVQVVRDVSGCIKIEFCTYRWPQVPAPAPDRVVPTARVAIAPGLAAVLRDQLTAALEGLKQQAELAAAPAASQAKN